MDSIYSIKTTDLHYVFSGLECAALIVLILVLTSYFIKRPGAPKGSHKTIIVAAAVLLSVGLAGAYATNLFNYLHYTRPAYVRLDNQIHHASTGL